MFEKSWQIKTHDTRTRVRPSFRRAGMKPIPRSVNLALAGLFKHPLMLTRMRDCGALFRSFAFLGEGLKILLPRALVNACVRHDYCYRWQRKGRSGLYLRTVGS